MTELELERIEKAKQEFISIWKNRVHMEGADELLDYLCKSSFFSDPASCSHHLAEPAGLVRHSLGVYHRLRSLMIHESETGTLDDDTEEEVALSALCHDLCKIGCFKSVVKNKRVYTPEVVEAVSAREPWKVKTDEQGSYVWQSVPGYAYEGPRVLGIHGDVSCAMVSYYLKPSPRLIEIQRAIRFHMSSFQEGEARQASAAFQKSKLALLLHLSDMLASFLDESRDSN